MRASEVGLGTAEIEKCLYLLSYLAVLVVCVLLYQRPVYPSHTSLIPHGVSSILLWEYGHVHFETFTALGAYRCHDLARIPRVCKCYTQLGNNNTVHALLRVNPLITAFTT